MENDPPLKRSQRNCFGGFEKRDHVVNRYIGLYVVIFGHNITFGAQVRNSSNYFRRHVLG